MSNIYRIIITCLHKQNKTLPTPPAKVGNYETWAHEFLKVLMIYDVVSKGVKDPVINQMVDEATKALEAIVDKSWVPEAEEKAREEHDHKIQEEAECIIQEKVLRVAKWDKWVTEKLMALLVGQITQEAFQKNSEAEQSMEGEESEVVGMEDMGATGGTQSSAMEVNKEEDEVIVVEEVKQGEMRKQAPSSPPKMSRKRVHVAMAMQPSVGSQGQGSLVQGSQAEVGQAGNMGKLCERCIKHWIACVVVRGGLGCNNCWAKHYGCSLVPVKEGVGGRGGPSGSQQAKAVVGSQTKGQARKARKPITLDPSKMEMIKQVQAVSAAGELCMSCEGLHQSINTLRAHLNTYNVEVWLILRKRETCVASVKELEEALVVEESTDEEMELRQEKVWYDVKRSQVACLKVVAKGEEEEDKDEGESGSEEEEDEPICHFRLLAKAKGKQPVK